MSYWNLSHFRNTLYTSVDLTTINFTDYIRVYGKTTI